MINPKALYALTGLLLLKSINGMFGASLMACVFLTHDKNLVKYAIKPNKCVIRNYAVTLTDMLC